MTPLGRELADREFPATPSGYEALRTWLVGYGQLVMVGVEGTGSYGAGLMRVLAGTGITVVEVDRPDILILEGLNVLQPPRTASKELLAVSDFFDLSVYVDADVEDLERWYLERIFKLRELAFNHPQAYFHQFASMPDDELEARGRDIWRRVNLPNLVENIAPTRSRADIVLRKGPEHKVSEVWLRKL